MVRQRGIAGLDSPGATASRVAAVALLVALALLPCAAQDTGFGDGAEAAPKKAVSTVARGGAEALFPLADSASSFATGFGGSVSVEFPVFPFLAPFARVSYAYAPLQAESSFNFSEGEAGLAFIYRPADFLELRFEAAGGMASVKSADFTGGSAYALAGRLGLGFRVHPAVTIYALGGAFTYLGSDAPFYTAATAGISASVKLDSIRSTSSKVKIGAVKTDPVFPVFYSYYDEHPFGTVKITNGEDTAIDEVEVSFVVGRYMDRPKVCVKLPSLAKGASTEVPITALFNDSVLSLTEGVTVRGEVSVSYSQLGAKRAASSPVEMHLYHRNAMNWLDDRRVAAFASPQDPASLWFSRFVAGVVRDRLRGDIDKNLQYAVGLFEAERLFGLAYVVDPASSYADNAANDAAVDYLQFPHQTLFYRGGDCDDLSILYTSLLESVGVDTAFITIPGHIYMAFALDTAADKAKDEFYDPGMLIFKEGRAWAPVEITMVKDGFVKAWRIGAKEWYDNVKMGSANFYPVHEAWKTYPSVGVPDVNPRFELPAESQLVQAFDLSLDRYVARDIDEKVASTKAASAAKAPSAAANDLGILYGRYGMLKEAWKQFGDSAKGGYNPAWTNLANIAFLRKDYKLSLEYYQHSRKLNPDDASAILGVARSYYELEYFDEADKAYEELKAASPELATKYGYLASILGGEGRAWSFSERLSSVSWAPQEKKAAPLVAPPKPAIAAAPAAAPALVPKIVEQAPVVVAPPAPELLAAPVAAEKVEAPAAEPAPQAAAAQAPAPEPEVTPQPEAAVNPAPVEAEPMPAAPEAAVAAAPEPAPIAPPITAEPSLPAAPAPAEPAPAPAPVEPAPVPEPKPAIAAAPAAPAPAPVIAEEAPEDQDIVEKAAAEKAQAQAKASALAVAPPPAAPVVVAPPKAAPIIAPAAPAEPPTIADELPEDKDIAEKLATEKAEAQAKASALVVAPPPAAPVVVAPPKAEPVAVAPPPAAPTVVEPPKAEPVAVAPPPAAPIVVEPPKAEPSAEDQAAKWAAVKAEKAASRMALKEAELAEGEGWGPFPEAPVAAAAPVPSVPAPAVEPTAPAPRAEPAAPAPTPEPAPVAAAPAPEPLPEVAAPEAAPAVAVEPEAAPVVAAPEAAPEPAPVVAVVPEPEAVPAAVAPEPEPEPVAAAGPEPVGESDLAPEPALVTVAEGFARFEKGSGAWKIGPKKAEQLDPKQYYAKIAMSLPQGGQIASISFKAKSKGSGWVGLGIHVYARGVKSHKYYGEGRSVLVWLTSDPVHRKDAGTRLQIYRSLSDTYIADEARDLLADLAVPESLFATHEYRVDIDPAKGELAVFVDGAERGRLSGLPDFTSADTIALRALDKAEFSDFRADEAR